MKARDLTPACIGRRVEIDSPAWIIRGRLDQYTARRKDDKTLDLEVILDTGAVHLDGTEPVTITG